MFVLKYLNISQKEESAMLLLIYLLFLYVSRQRGTRKYLK